LSGTVTLLEKCLRDTPMPYSFANAEHRPGPRIGPAEVQELLKRTGLEPLYKLEYADENQQ